MRPRITFLGAARTVTGSKYLLEWRGRRVLFEAGLFQGLKELRLRNWARFPVPATSLDAVVITHAHVDHSGYLPRLVRQGFAARVFCTPATRKLLEIVLPDAGHLQEEEAKYANRKGYSKHRPALPLFTRLDGEKAARLATPRPYRRWFEVVPGLWVRFHPAGHILGSSFVEARAGRWRLVFSGDLGGYGRPVMSDPSSLPPAPGHVLVETTYGGRVEEREPVERQFARAVGPALERGGVVVIPAFAIGRTTLVLYHLRRLMDRGRLPDVPVHVDSPMAVDAVELYCRFGDDPNLRPGSLLDQRACPARPHRLELVRTPERSRELNDLGGPRIIISASGMATGGRVLHHLAHRLPDPRNLVLLVGYQAEGTRGRRLLEGEDRIKIHGRFVPVRAEVRAVHGLSAHGGEDDVLRWLKTAKTRPRRVFLVHGEPPSIAAFARRLRAWGWTFTVPRYGQRFELDRR